VDDSEKTVEVETYPQELFGRTERAYINYKDFKKLQAKYGDYGDRWFLISKDKVRFKDGELWRNESLKDKLEKLNKIA
jgi:hypothetical protein